MAKTRIKIPVPADWPVTTEFINGIKKKLIDKGADPTSVLRVVTSHDWNPIRSFAMDPIMTDAEKAALKADAMKKILAEAEKAGLKVKVTA
jgi:hypothetical protein